GSPTAAASPRHKKCPRAVSRLGGICVVRQVRGSPRLRSSLPAAATPLKPRQPEQPTTEQRRAGRFGNRGAAAGDHKVVGQNRRLVFDARARIDVDDVAAEGTGYVGQEG